MNLDAVADMVVVMVVMVDAAAGEEVVVEDVAGDSLVAAVGGMAMDTAGGRTAPS